MTQTNTKAAYKEPEKSRSTFPVGVSTAFLVILFLGLFIYVFWQKKSVGNQITILEERIQAKQESIDVFTQGKSVQDHLNSVVALEEVLETQIDWSQANRAISSIGIELQEEVVFDDYSSNQNGEFQLQGIAANTEGIAKTLERFNASPQFKDPFVTTISERSNGGTRFGARTPVNIFPFSLTFTFIQQES